MSARSHPTPSEMPDELRDLIRAADRTREPRARAILEQCRAQLPHYQRLPAPGVEDIVEKVLHHLSLFYHVTLEIGRTLDDADLEPSRAAARERAGQGVPLGEFMMFFHVGLRVAWEDLMERVADDPRLRAGLLDRVSAVIGNQQLLMAALTEAYLQESERLSRFRERDLDEFFRLLMAEDTMAHVLDARAQALGLDLDEPLTAVVFAPSAASLACDPPVAPEDLRRRLETLVQAGEIRAGRCREGFVALLPTCPDEKALSVLAEGLFGPDVRVGVGESAVDGDIRRSVRQALRAVQLGSQLRPAQRVHAYATVAVADLIDVESGRAREFMRSVLGPLAGKGANAAHIETLRELARNGFRVKLAAAALDVHPHTLSYRIKQIRRRFGLDLDDPEVRTRVQLALLVLDGQGAVGASRSTSSDA